MRAADVMGRVVSPATRTMTGVVPMRIAGRTGYSVNVRRVMPVATVPRRRTPIGYKAQGSQRRDAENGYTGCCVTIHGATIGVTVNRESVGVVACGCPACTHAGAIAIRGVGERAVAVYRCNHTRAQQQSCAGQCGGDFMSDFHILFLSLICFFVNCPAQYSLYAVTAEYI